MRSSSSKGSLSEPCLAISDSNASAPASEKSRPFTILSSAWVKLGISVMLYDCQYAFTRCTIQIGNADVPCHHLPKIVLQRENKMPGFVHQCCGFVDTLEIFG